MTLLSWPFRIVWFVLWFASQVLISNVAVIRDNLTPGQNSTPGVATLETRCRTDAELTLLAALITITPGTLTLGTSPAASAHAPAVLHIHGMYHEHAESLRAEVREIETRMLRAMRPHGGSQ